VSKEVSKKRQDSRWDDAIRLATQESEALKQRIAQLGRAIRVFRLNKQDGVPWPESPTESERK
jgi:hypothetical protein